MIEQIFPANLNFFDEVNDFAEKMLETSGVNIRFIPSILIAVEEIFVNIARYAYPEGDGKVVVSISIDNEKCTIRFEDSGVPFNPLEKKDPDTKISAEERKIGGLGIYMVKKSMDKVTYKFADKKNILTIEKNIS